MGLITGRRKTFLTTVFADGGAIDPNVILGDMLLPSSTHPFTCLFNINLSFSPVRT